ncbi:CMRF35-like molecule 5 [Rhinoraja longicauda]
MGSASKMMLVPILLICFLPVSGAPRAKKYVSGVVGKNITIDCHYEAWYHSHTKYWCQGWTHQCTVVVETNGQHRRNGRVSITDNPTQRIFTVTVEDLHSGDTGWYRCGITAPGKDRMFNVYLQVSDEPNSPSGTEPMMTTPLTSAEKRSNDSQNGTTRCNCTECYMLWKVGRWLYFTLLGMCSISVSLYTSIRK